MEPHLRTSAIGLPAAPEQAMPPNAATISADRHRLRMLAVLASPVAGAQGGRPEGQPLDVWGEWERLRSAIGVRDAIDGGGAPWAVARLTPPTAETLADTLAAAGKGFQVLHFGCHGGPRGLHLEDDLGRECEIPTARLVDALRGRGVDLVVLNACETAQVAEALVEQARVRAVIATRMSICDDEARVLAERLYRGLALGRPIGQALAAVKETIAERHRAGDLGISSCPPALAQERADNLFLVGDPALTLEVEQPTAETPLFVLDPTPRNDPLRLDLVADFVGRHEELLRLARWFAETGRLAFAISGVGGIGKTALALNAALRAAHRFEALAVASARDNPDLSPTRVLEAIAAAQNVPASSPEMSDPAAAVARRMNDSRILLVLDNLETIGKRVVDELARSLAGVRPESGSRVLLTLRPQEKGALSDLVPHGDRLALFTLDRPNALGKAWNQAERDRLLTGPPAPPPETSSGGTNVELEQIAREAWLYGQDSAWLAALDDLATRAFRHPKMIELAVSLVAQRGWTAARQRLTQLTGREITAAFNELIGTLLDDLTERHPEALEVLHAALVFRGGAAAPLLRFVVLGREVAEGTPDAIEFEDGPLSAAERSSLFSRTKADGTGVARFDLDPPIRAYLERFRPPVLERLETLRLRHAEALVAVLKHNARQLRRSISLASIPEWSNLTAAWEWLTAEPLGPRGKLLISHAKYWANFLLGTATPSAHEWFEASLMAARHNGDLQSEGWALFCLARMSGLLQDLDSAFEHYQAALKVHRSACDKRGEAAAHDGLADLGVVGDRFRKGALGHAHAALTLYERLSDTLGKANCLGVIGDLLRLQGDFNASSRYYQDSLVLSRQLGYRLGEAGALIGIGTISLLQGDQQTANQRLEEAAGILLETGDQYNMAATYGNYGFRLLKMGLADDARAYLQRAADLFETLGSRFVDHRKRCRSMIEEIDNLSS